MPSVPGPLRKTVSQRLEEVMELGKKAVQASKGPAKVAGRSYKLARKLEYVEFYNNKNQFTHKVNFSDAEQNHLRNGGTIIVVHACGNELHVKVPKVI